MLYKFVESGINEYISQDLQERSDAAAVRTIILPLRVYDELL